MPEAEFEVHNLGGHGRRCSPRGLVARLERGIRAIESYQSSWRLLTNLKRTG